MMKRIMLICALILVPFPFSLPPCSAQPPDRIDPFSPFVGQFIKVGEMNDSTLTSGVHPIGDCDRNGLNEWILHRQPRDTVINHFGNPRLPLDVYLYRGVHGQLPSIEDGERIGLTEVGVLHQFLASGDWDNDGNLDLAIRTMKLNDSTYGTRAADQFDLIIFWGNVEGRFSLDDTTRLMSRGDAWIWLGYGLSGDFDQDDIDDLLLHSARPEGGIARMIGGGTISAPTMSLFLGKEKERWGRNGIHHRADWEWWRQPFAFNRVGTRLIDQNCDNASDVVLYNDVPSGGHISVLYGTPGGGLPDTTNVETVALSSPPGGTSQLIDVSGDAILDLLVLDPLSDSQTIRVYPGEPEATIAEVYGTGMNSWAAIPTPIVLHDGWGGFNPDTRRFYELGDVNRDGTNDILCYTHPFFVSYTAGDRLDSLIDGYYRFDGLAPQTYVNLGNIDGSEWNTIAVGYTSLNYGSGVVYLHGSDSIAREGVFRRLPHQKTRRCFSTISVTSRESRAVSHESLGVQVLPNPANEEVRVVWNSEAARGRNDEGVKTSIANARGEEVFSMRVPANVNETMWNASAVAAGSYFITVTIGDRSETISILLQP